MAYIFNELISQRDLSYGLDFIFKRKGAMDPGLDVISQIQLQLCSDNCHKLSLGMNSGNLMSRNLQLANEIGSNLGTDLMDYPLSIFCLSEIELAKWHKLLWEVNNFVNRYKRLNRGVQGWRRFKRRFK